MLNLTKEATIALCAQNCIEWFIADFAAILSCIPTVSLHPGKIKLKNRYYLLHFSK